MRPSSWEARFAERSTVGGKISESRFFLITLQTGENGKKRTSRGYLTGARIRKVIINNN
jgi:hypothetical protein